MLYSIRNLFSVLLVAAVVNDVAFGRVIHGPHNRKYRDVRRGTAKVTGLDFLQKYVCSPCATNVKRQNGTGPGVATINIPVSNLPALYLELQSLKTVAIDRMIEEGLTTTKRSAWSKLLKRTDASEVVPVQISSLEVLKTYVCPPCSTKRQTAIYIANFNIKIPAADLQGLLDALEDLINRIVQILTGYGLPIPTQTTNLPAATPPVPTSSIPDVSVTALPVTSSFSVVSTLPAVSSQTATVGIPANSEEEHENICPATTTIDMTTTVGPIVDVPTLPVTKFSTSTSTETSTLSVTTILTSTVTYTNANPGPSASETPSLSGYVFDEGSSKNVAVYFGQTAATGGTNLANQCADADIDIVVLAFIIGNNYGGSIYPQVNFGAACGGQTPIMMSEAPGLLSCTELASHISTCQKTYGKKVFLSIGGATAGVIFNSADEATDFGNTLWNLFGPTGNVDGDLRPFGDVVIDGFDFDNENNRPAYYELVAQTFRSNFATSTSKNYYLSSAPQCPFPDASNPQGVILLCDFVFVQFYNNQPCEIGSSGFVDSVKQWSSALTQSTLSPQPRLYVGAPAWNLAGPSAYANIGSPKGMLGVAQQVTALGLPNLGGLMYWDGAEGVLNIEDGKDIISWGKSGL